MPSRGCSTVEPTPWAMSVERVANDVCQMFLRQSFSFIRSPSLFGCLYSSAVCVEISVPLT